MKRESYNPEKDQMIELITEIPNGDLVLRVAIFRYDDFAPKIRVHRVGQRKDGKTYTAGLSSLTADEAKALSPALIVAADRLQAMT